MPIRRPHLAAPTDSRPMPLHLPTLMSLFAVLALSSACAGTQKKSEIQQIEDGDVIVLTAPEVSSSRGEVGGFVLLWPRVIPRAQVGPLRVQAKALQDRLRVMLEQRFRGRPIDVRPEPERVCPKIGCRTTSVGALVLFDRGYCAVVALVTPPGRSPQQLIPWGGRVATPNSLPFREPPESSVRVTEFIPCGDLEARLAAEADVERALEALP